MGSGSFTEFGYHTATFSTPYATTQGQAFYVGVRLTVPDFRSTPVPKIALEDKVKGYTSGASATTNQTFISDDGRAGTTSSKTPRGSPARTSVSKAYTAAIDGPHTTVAGADSKWHKADVILSSPGRRRPASTARSTASMPADLADGRAPTRWRRPSAAATTGSHHHLPVGRRQRRDQDRAQLLGEDRHTGARDGDRGPATVRKYGYVTVRYRVSDLPTEVDRRPPSPSASKTLWAAPRS